jgi:hypothetical protein
MQYNHIQIIRSKCSMNFLFSGYSKYWEGKSTFFPLKDDKIQFGLIKLYISIVNIAKLGCSKSI